MMVSRRQFLAASGGLIAAPALAGARKSVADAEVIIIGAGAAGIAVGRRLVAAGRKVIIVDAMDRIGGRAWTVLTPFGAALDLGARGLFGGERDPIRRAARAGGLEPSTLARKPLLDMGGRRATAGEAASFAEVLGAAQSGLRAAAAAGADGPASAVLPVSGDWRATINFTLGPMALSRDLDSVSAVEAAMAVGREGPSLRDGCGALLGQMAEGLPLHLATMVSRIDWSGPEVRVETKKGTLRTGAVIVTASTAALASRRLRFVPDLPVSMTQAIAALPLGTLNPIAFELPEDPLGVGPDADITFKASSASTLRLIANIGGSAICLAMIGGRFGKELEEESDLVTVAWVRDFLVQRFGGAIGPRMGRSVVAHWGLEPTILGAASAAVPGAASQRLVLREPLAGCLYFAGEATSPDAFGTLHGAWLEGERAAGELLARRQ